MNSFFLGLRSLLFRKRQYVSLFFVCMVGVGISLFSVFVINGMLDSLKQKAKIYYGGDYQILGGLDENRFENSDEFIKKIEGVFPEKAIVAPRYEFSNSDSVLYFEGEGIHLRMIKGVDFSKEKKLFERFNYVSGSPDNIAGTNGILISKPIAQMLGVKTGDVITFMLNDVSQHVNTVPLEVKGIFTDSSLFGMYTSYMDINALRDAFKEEAGVANRIVISFPERDSDISKAELYQAKLEKILNMFPYGEGKDDFYDFLHDGKFTEPTYALIPLDENLRDVKILIDAMHGISNFVIITLILIIIIGISSTYRVLVMKRSNEIGIYMAIGMRRRGIRKILLSENFVLLISGCFAGFLLSLLLCYFTKFVNFSFIPAFDLFLTNGVIAPVIDAPSIFMIWFVVIVTTTLAVLFAVQKSVNMTPCQALAVTG